jgi:uncharacterized protein
MATQLARVLQDRRYWFLVPLSYLGLIACAELLTALVAPRAGMILHCLLLPALLWHAAWAARSEDQALLACMAFAPLIRIVSLWLSLPEFSPLHHYLIASLPLFATVWVAGRTLGYSGHALALELRSLPVQMAVGLTGLIVGVLGYLILRPPPVATSLTWAEAWQPVLILLVCTGLLEELIFRGLLLRAGRDSLGSWGLWYTSVLFATMQIGYRSPAHFAFAFVMGAVWAWVVQRTGSLLGVALAHGLTNVVAFLVMPFVFGS